MATRKFLDETGVQTLAEGILGKVNTKINDRIVTELNDQSDDKHVLSAKKLYELLKTAGGTDPEINGKVTKLTQDLETLTGKVDGLANLTIELVVGELNTNVPAPKGSVLYFHKDSDLDPTWDIYIYKEVSGSPTWIAVGNTEVDLTNYWKKDDIDNLKAALGFKDIEAITEDDINAKVEAAFASSQP